MPCCPKCGRVLKDKDFAWRYKEKGERQRLCRDCRSKENRAWYERHHEKHRQNVRQRKADARDEAWRFIQSEGLSASHLKGQMIRLPAVIW